MPCQEESSGWRFNSTVLYHLMHGHVWSGGCCINHVLCWTDTCAVHMRVHVHSLRDRHGYDNWDKRTLVSTEFGITLL